jgi:ArsR family transcriptional regulator
MEKLIETEPVDAVAGDPHWFAQRHLWVTGRAARGDGETLEAMEGLQAIAPALFPAPLVLEGPHYPLGARLRDRHEQQHRAIGVELAPRFGGGVGGIAPELLGEAGGAHGPEVHLYKGAIFSFARGHVGCLMSAYKLTLMWTAKSVRDETQRWKALGDPVRWRIVCLLSEVPRSVTSLCEELDTYQSLVSGHLAVLKQAGLVAANRDGYLRVYRLEPGALILLSERLGDLARG